MCINKINHVLFFLIFFFFISYSLLDLFNAVQHITDFQQELTIWIPEANRKRKGKKHADFWQPKHQNSYNLKLTKQNFTVPNVGKQSTNRTGKKHNGGNLLCS